MASIWLPPVLMAAGPEVEKVRDEDTAIETVELRMRRKRAGRAAAGPPEPSGRAIRHSNPSSMIGAKSCRREK